MSDPPQPLPPNRMTVKLSNSPLTPVMGWMLLLLTSPAGDP